VALPVARTLDRIEDIAGKISAALPVIRSTADSVSTAINGHPTPAGAQTPAQVQALVPRNVGGLDLNVAKAGISGALIVWALVAVGVFFLVKRR